MTSPSAAPDLRALFAGARRSVVRVETLKAYDVGGDEAESLAAWRAGHPRPERSPRTNSYLAAVASAVARGVVWERLRVIDSPPTDYQRYQLLGYLEGQAAGELVTLTDRRLAPAMLADVWVIDYTTVVLMSYTPRGEWLENELAPDAAVPPALVMAQRVRERGVTLDDYLAGPGAASRAS